MIIWMICIIIAIPLTLVWGGYSESKHKRFTSKTDFTKEEWDKVEWWTEI